ncbi:MAG: hypothetical protein ACI9BF_000615, partial [Candidatus Paceibacteria bacterium]
MIILNFLVDAERSSLLVMTSNVLFIPFIVMRYFIVLWKTKAARTEGSCRFFLNLISNVEYLEQSPALELGRL